MDLATLQRELDTRDDGVLRKGSHRPGREFCALEFESQVRGRQWSDSPETMPDLRPLNDAQWSSNGARTKGLLPVMVALWGWSTWTPKQRQAWVSKVIVRTVREIIAELPGLPEPVRVQCRAAKTLKETEAAAEAAAWAAWAAEAADTVLNLACTIWIEAAEEITREQA